MTPEHIAVWITHKEVSCWHFNNNHREKLQQLFPDSRISVCNNEETFLQALATADLALIWKFKQEWLKVAKKLKIISTPAAGKDYFQVTDPGNVKMLYGRFHGPLMAETVVGMISGAARGLFSSITNMRERQWNRGALDATMKSLNTSQATIWGFGNIGRETGRKLHSLGMKICGIKRNRCLLDNWYTLYSPDDLEKVLPQTDHLVLCLPRSAETDQLLNSKNINMLPDHAWVYNIGRGNAIDEKALVEALQNGKLAGAFLDVCQTEPLPQNSPLWQTPNLYIMPHSSAISPQYLELYLDELAEMITIID